MNEQKIKKLKLKYQEARDGLDRLQEEVLKRGIELRPGLRHQFEEALRGLFYTMACADGHIDAREVSFYNTLFDEQLSVTTFELVRVQLERSRNVFEQDLLKTITAFATYDRSITGLIPLSAPSLSALLLGAGEALGRMVMESDGEVRESEAQALRELLQTAKQRAELVRAGAESLLETNKEGKTYDPEAAVARDIRGVERALGALLTEAAMMAADLIEMSGIALHRPELSGLAEATHFVADSVRDDLERGDAGMDLVMLAASQIGPMMRAMDTLSSSGDVIKPTWRALAERAHRDTDELLARAQRSMQQRVWLLKEKHDWHERVTSLEESLEQVWQTAHV